VCCSNTVVNICVGVAHWLRCLLFKYDNTYFCCWRIMMFQHNTKHVCCWSTLIKVCVAPLQQETYLLLKYNDQTCCYFDTIIKISVFEIQQYIFQLLEHNDKQIWQSVGAPKTKTKTSHCLPWTDLVMRRLCAGHARVMRKNSDRFDARGRIEIPPASLVRTCDMQTVLWHAGLQLRRFHHQAMFHATVLGYAPDSACKFS
jgi:hypothetical protein